MIIQMTEEEYLNLRFKMAKVLLKYLDGLYYDDTGYSIEEIELLKGLRWRDYSPSDHDDYDIYTKLNDIAQKNSYVQNLERDKERLKTQVYELQGEIDKLKSSLHQTLSGTDESNAQPTAPKKTFIKTWFK
jgi:hypothetical protein